MAKGISDAARVQEVERVYLSELIHQEVRVAIETAVHEELRAALGARPYERSEVRRGYRNGTKTLKLTGPTGPVALTLPRAMLFTGGREWTSRVVPRYHRRMPEVNEATTSSATLSEKRQSTRSLRSGTTFIASFTFRMATPLAPLTRLSSAHGPSAAPGS